MFLSFLSFFFSPRDLRAPSADRRETLPRDRKYVQFYNLGPKIWEAFHPKILWREAKITVDFGQLQTSIANISGTDRDTKMVNLMCNVDSDSSRIWRKKSDELWCTNNKVGHVSLSKDKRPSQARKCRTAVRRSVACMSLLFVGAPVRPNMLNITYLHPSLRKKDTRTL